MARARWLPFTLRLYFYAGSDSLRVLHTIVFDGDESKDFIRGIGLRFSAPLTDALHDRHVRFVGEQAACSPKPCAASPACAAIPARPRARRRSTEPPRRRHQPRWSPSCLQYIPAFGDWTLLQPNANSFTIRKRTADGHAWLDCGAGPSRERARVRRRARPAASPSASAISGRAIPRSSTSATRMKTQADVTMWVWAPDADADGPALLSRRPGPGHVREAAQGRPRDHLRRLRARLRHADGRRAHQRADAVGAAGDAGARAHHGAGAMRCARRPSWCRRRRPRSTPASSAIRSRCRRRPRPNMRNSNSGSTGCSISIAASRISAAGTGSGTTATSCTPMTSTATNGATTSAASPGTTPSSPPTCGCGCISCAPAAPIRSASPKP